MSSKCTKQFNDGNHELVLLACRSDFFKIDTLPPMVNRLIIIICFVLPLKATAQVLDFGIPEKLSLSINSDAEEGMPLLSPDGKLLFVKKGPLDTWTWSKLADRDLAFVYGREGPTTYFTAAPKADYAITLDVLEPDRGPSKYSARLLAKSGGWK